MKHATVQLSPFSCYFIPLRNIQATLFKLVGLSTARESRFYISATAREENRPTSFG
jgi:hypothetical protein